MGPVYEKITPGELSAVLEKRSGTSLKDASREQLYFALSDIIAGRLKAARERTEKKQRNSKKVYYLSMEFLVGKNLKYNASATGLFDCINDILSESGNQNTIDDIATVERDPGLGNGGLGRLAACYMNSLSSLDYPGTGYSICYEKGFFTQSIVDGEQIERPDDWLKTGKAWLVPKDEETVRVSMGGKIRESWQKDRLYVMTDGAEEFRAVPYDLLIPGFLTDTVNRIRLWKAEKVMTGEKGPGFPGPDEWGGDEISSSLYPPDELTEGKLLRLSQQYFLVSASVSDILREHEKIYGSLDRFADLTAIHVNDTHPALAIPELIRILLDDYGLTWDDAWRITNSVFSYTNHTVMPEALETWNVDLFRIRLPRIFRIIKEINEKVCSSFWDRFPGDFSRISRMAPVSYSRIRMAELCASSVHSVNGVSKIHSEILRKTVFGDYSEYSPDLFTSVTNGVSHIRWLKLCNPALTVLIKDCIGDGFEKDPSRLSELLKYKDDRSFLESLARVKKVNAGRLSAKCENGKDTSPDPDSVFDVQIKRFHEYKRQLMNALKILYVYVSIKNGQFSDLPPLTFVFGGKAAPGYKTAKDILRLIWNIGVLISSDKTVSERIKVLFAEDYGVSSAEIIIPAAYVSEQISLAGKEASGTGCMKMMMNGALTLGTPDGANIEIRDAVGDENTYIFGHDSSEVERIYRDGYRPMKYYMRNDRVRVATDALDLIPDKYLTDEIKRYLLFSGDSPDPYMCLCDFETYLNAWERSVRDAANKDVFARKSLVNIAQSGYFSSDRAVKEYAEKIWGIKRIN